MNSLVPDDNYKLESEFTVTTCLYISEMKSEVENLVQRCHGLESHQSDTDKKINDYEKDLAECRLLISQHEAPMKSLQESMREAENQKRTLEENIDALREECAKTKAAVHAASTKEKAEEKENASKVKAAMEEQMDQLCCLHYRRLAELGDEINEKQTLINELKETSQKYVLAHQQLQQEEAEKSQQLQELVVTNARREQTKRDLIGLEDTVSKELQTLHNLGKLFESDIQSKNEDDGGSLAQKQKIRFLQNDLDQLTKVHQQAVRHNADLRCELSKLVEKVKALETKLENTKKEAMRDRRRYEYEVDRIKEAVKQKITSRRPGAQIVKPIRTGQQHMHPSMVGDFEYPDSEEDIKPEATVNSCKLG